MKVHAHVRCASSDSIVLHIVLQNNFLLAAATACSAIATALELAGICHDQLLSLTPRCLGCRHIPQLQA